MADAVKETLRKLKESRVDEASDNFYIYVDREGKLPQLRRGVWQSKTHPFWVKYVANKPVEARPYPGETKVWDYSKNEYVPIKSIKQAAEIQGEQVNPFIDVDSAIATLRQGLPNSNVLGRQADAILSALKPDDPRAGEIKKLKDFIQSFSSASTRLSDQLTKIKRMSTAE